MEQQVTELPKPPSEIRRIFIGGRGIRAGWSVAIFIAILAVISFALVFPVRLVLQHMHLPMNGSLPVPTGSMELALFLGVLCASMIMTRIEHKPAISYGLDGPNRIKNFLWGLLFGFIALSVLVGALKLFGFIQFDGEQIFGFRAVKYAVAWGVVFIIVGLYEEYTMRGYLLAILSRGIGFWWSAVILSVAFGSLHLSNTGESPVGIFSAAAIGLLFCVSLWYLKTLWWAIGFHAAWDWAESYFWGTADSGLTMKGHLFGVHPQGNILWSGGATGPEGSMLVVPLLIIIGLLMWLAWRKKRVAAGPVAESGATS